MVNAHNNKSRISLELLQLFIAVVQQGNISAAARAWNIAPSLANRKIAALETELKTTLFMRSNRSIHLTEAGSLTFAWAQKVVSDHGQLTDELALMQNDVSGMLRIISNEYLLTFVMPEFLAEFSLKFPEINFDLTMTDTIISNERRDYDVVIFSGQVPDTALKGTRIHDYKRVICASPEFLERNGVPETLESLAQYDCLVHQQAVNGCWTFRKDGELLKQRVRIKTLSSSHMPLIQLATNGMGIIQVSKDAIKADLQSGRLITLLDDYECVNADGSHPSTWAIFPGKRNLTRTKIFVSELKTFLRGMEAPPRLPALHTPSN